LTLLNVKFNLLTLFEGAVAGHLNRGLVHKDVRASLLRDEAEAVATE